MNVREKLSLAGGEESSKDLKKRINDVTEKNV